MHTAEFFSNLFRTTLMLHDLYGMHPVVCYLQKDIIWDRGTKNNQKETK
jgi:hypothetical protein